MSNADNPSSAPSAPASGDAGHQDSPFRYRAAFANEVELRWQKYWADHDTFHTPNPGDDDFDASRPKFYCMDMFPYPSGAGLHVGHPEGYTATDIICRYRRMKGFNVLHPMGWDAFGLPAEQYAIQTGVHPAITTRRAIDTFRRQLQRFGFSYDWAREFATIDEDYYAWTQWIWLKAYDAWYDRRVCRARTIDELRAELADGTLNISADRTPIAASDGGQPFSSLDAAAQREFIDDQRLAYLGTQTVNWCPKLGTALANEEVIDGRSERGSHPVLRKPLRQWMFRITAFADRLAEDLETLDWPQSTRTMQREWIGRSEGAEVDFPFADAPAGLPADAKDGLRVYTTRPDTIFGATYMVIAPEHPLVDAILASPNAGTDTEAIRSYVETACNRADIDRMADNKEKTGVATGFHAVNPASGQLIPIWIADYVLMGYGHGAIMAVPAHDGRDYEFAKAFDLPIVDVVYTTAHRAIRACCERAGEIIQDRARFLTVLADYVGHAVNARQNDLRHNGAANDSNDTWDDIWNVVTSRRQDPSPPLPKSTPDRRGAICSIWRDTLEAFIGEDPQELITAITHGQLADYMGSAIVEAGRNVNSHNDGVSIDGLPTDEAKAQMISWLEANGIGRGHVNYRLRDWLFARQRYWGEPFPIVFDEAGNHYPVSETALPVALPELVDYEPVESNEPAPLLAKAVDWVNTTAGEAGVSPDLLPADTPVRRETNTMPGWAGSCWYYLRYCDPKNSDRLVSREAERYWMLSSRSGNREEAESYGTFMPELHHLGGVDLYIGGAEHAVLHLLYARFWHKILFDLGEVNTPEPFGRLFHQGMITSFAYQRSDKTLAPVNEVDVAEDETATERATGEKVKRITAKMSKSLHNVINPDDVIAEYGADTFRLYEMYMGPLDASKPWNTQDILGPFRFLQRTWRLMVNEETGDLKLRDNADESIKKLLHRTIAKVGPDIDRLAFNTAIAAMIEFVNAAGKAGGLTRGQAETFTLIIAPFAPHLAEELWLRLGHDTTLAYASWPAVDEKMLHDDTIELPVQINGKVRARITVPADADNDTVQSVATAQERVAAELDGKTIRKVIVVPGKIINIIAN